MKFRERNWAAYGEGRAAFYEGRSSSDCPYEGRGKQPNQSDDRLDWMNGYYEAKYVDKWEARRCILSK